MNYQRLEIDHRGLCELRAHPAPKLDRSTLRANPRWPLKP